MDFLGHLLLNRSFWEQPYLDLWSIPHTIVGILFALASLLAGFSLRRSMLASIFLTTLWEMFEVITGVSKAETLSNQFSDIIVAQIGFFVVWYSMRNSSLRNQIIALVFFGSLYAVAVFFGWLAFSYYVSHVQQ